MRRYRITTLSGSRTYYLHTPRGVRRTTRVPLVVALHGCDQTALDFAQSTRFNTLADQHGFAVVYPEQSRLSNGQRCWSWYRAEHQSRHRGEPAIIAAIVRRLLGENRLWRIDPTRVYLTGISAGGGMAMVLAATHPELFAAVGVHSAPPYRSATRSSRAVAAMQGHTVPHPAPTQTVAMPPLIVLQGTSDLTVRRSNARRLTEQWLEWYRASAPSSTTTERTRRHAPAKPFSNSGTRGYTISHWSAGRRRVLECWQVDGLGHAWSGGSREAAYSDPRGPRASTVIWRFFSRHSNPHLALRKQGAVARAS